MKRANTETLALYHAAYCPYCVRVRNVIADLNINIISHDIFRDTAKAKELVQNGGKRQVPCLRIDTVDGETEWLYESKDIINYLHKYAQNIANAA